MPAAPGARRSILLSLALVAAGIAAAACHFPRQRAYAAEAQQRSQLARAPRVDVLVDGEYVIEGMAVDARGRLYITAKSEDHVYAMSKAGKRIKFTDRDEEESDPSRRRSLAWPRTLAADRAGNLYAVDASGPTSGCLLSSRIKKIAADGTVSALAQADAAMAAHNMGPYIGVAVDSGGDVYMKAGDTAYKVSGTAELLQLRVPDGAGMSGFPELEGGIAAHPDGGVIVANSQHGLYRVLPDGRALRLETHGGDCSLGTSTPPVPPDRNMCRSDANGTCAKQMATAQAVPCRINAVAVDAGGRIFLSDDARILRVDTDGTISTLFDPDQGRPILLKEPVQDYPLTLMALSPHGEVYWARFSTLYKITPWSRAPRR